MIKQNEFSFYGARDYVLGADILKYAVSELHPSGHDYAIDFTVKSKLTSKECRLVPKDASSALDEENALATLISAGKPILILAHGNKIEQRKECIEHELAQNFSYVEVGNNPIVNVQEVPDGMIFHSCVSAFKYLLNNCVLFEKKSYLFTRLKLNTLLLAPFSIQYKRMVAKSYYEGIIYNNNDDEIGAIYFKRLE